MYQFVEGEYVIILNDEYYARSGIINKVIDCSCGIKDYEVKLATSDGITVCHGKDLVSAVRSDGRFVPAKMTDNMADPMKVDPELTMIKSYLTEDDRMNLATEIFKRKISENFETAMKNRSEANLSFIDQVVHEVANVYVTKLGDQHYDEFNEIIKKVIDDEVKSSEFEDFATWMRYKLEHVAEKWIHDNKTQVIDLMMNVIETAAKNVSLAKLGEIINKNVADSVHEVLHGDKTIEEIKIEAEKPEENWMFKVVITVKAQHIRCGPGVNYMAYFGYEYRVNDIVEIKDVRHGEQGADLWGMVSFLRTVEVDGVSKKVPTIGWIAIHSKYNSVCTSRY